MSFTAEVGLLRCMLCGGFIDYLQDAVIWFSSGSTESVLHFDAVDNINCVMDGQKEIYLVDKVWYVSMYSVSLGNNTIISNIAIPVFIRLRYREPFQVIEISANCK